MIKHLRKSVIASMAMLLCLGTEVKAQDKLGLQEINAMYEGDYAYHHYNKAGLLDSTYTYTSFYDEELYRLFSYNEEGLLVKDEGYCILPPEISDKMGFSKSCEIVYEYDKKGRKISRMNYNLDVFGGTDQFLLGGKYVYEYDSTGKLKQHKMYWDEACTNLYEIGDYEYDEMGRLIKKTINQNNFGVESVASTANYFYDELGRLIRVRNDAMNPETGEMGENDNTIYKYDDNNNLISRIRYTTDPSKPVEQRDAFYDLNTLAKDVSLPINHEDDMDFYTLSQNIIVKDSVYRRNAEEESVFELYDVNEYLYVNLEEAAGIDNVISNNDMIAMKRDNEGNVLLGGISDFESIRVYDAQGKMVRNGLYNGKLDVSGLPAGMYIVSTSRGSVKFSK